MKKSPLYTRSGDKGHTMLADGSKVTKNSLRVHAYGSIDELNSLIGLVRAHLAGSSKQEEDTLAGIGNSLFNIGAYMATPDKEPADLLPSILAGIPIQTENLEKEIDRLDEAVEPLRQFILPGGSIAAAEAHVARSVCRRAERDTLSLLDSGVNVHPVVLSYLNRLSDYLFVLARYLNHIAGIRDITWNKG